MVTDSIIPALGRLARKTEYKVSQGNKASMPENEKLIVISTLVSDLSGSVVSYHDLISFLQLFQS